MWHYEKTQSQQCNNDDNDNDDTMMCGLNSLIDYDNVKTHDIWEKNMTTRREIHTEHIHSLGFEDRREAVTLWRLRCITKMSSHVEEPWITHSWSRKTEILIFYPVSVQVDLIGPQGTNNQDLWHLSANSAPRRMVRTNTIEERGCQRGANLAMLEGGLTSQKSSVSLANSEISWLK
jgi:hypothetical protein